MGWLDWTVLGLIAATVGFAVYRIIRHRGKGGCGGTCATCSADCEKKEP